MMVYGGLMEFNGIYPLVNIQKTMESAFSSWVNPLFLWPGSIVILTSPGRVPSSHQLRGSFIYFDDELWPCLRGMTYGIYNYPLVNIQKAIENGHL